MGAGGAVPRILAKRSSAVSYLAGSEATGARAVAGSGSNAEGGAATGEAAKERGTETEA